MQQHIEFLHEPLNGQSPRFIAGNRMIRDPGQPPPSPNFVLQGDCRMK
jgi:hypothetical protein